MNKKTFKKFIASATWCVGALAIGVVTLATVATAQSRTNKVYGDVVPADRLDERIPVPAERREDSRAAAVRESGWGMRVSPGLTVHMFDEEDTDVAGAVFFDVWERETPLNFRVGAEVGHMDFDQDNAVGSFEAGRDKAEVTYVRIPFAVEYIVPVADEMNLYLGGGPDILTSANDVDDTSVGGHLGARLGYDFADNWGVAVEAGYQWNELEGRDGKDLDLDGAYISPLLTYTF